MPPKSTPKAAPKPVATSSKATASPSIPLTLSPSTNPVVSLWKAYNERTSDRLRFVDAFLVFLMLTGVVQFVYCVLVTNYPFNAFLAGFASTVGQFVLTASLRAQVNPENRNEFKDVSPERAFADFALGSIVLHFFVYNFLG